MFKPRARIKGRLWDRIASDFPWHSDLVSKFREFLVRRGSARLIHDFAIPRTGCVGRAFQPTSDVRFEVLVKRGRATGRAIVTIAGMHVLDNGKWVEVLPLIPAAPGN